MEQQTLEVQIKAIKDEILGKISEGASKADLRTLQSQVDLLDIAMQKGGGHFIRGGGGDSASLFKKALEDSPEFTRFRELGKGTATISLKDLSVPLLETKTDITSAALGATTVGVLGADRLGGIVPTAQRRLFLRDLLPKSRTTQGSVYFIKELAFTNNASPQQEASAKSESADTFTTVQRNITTLAHWLPISVQALQDFDLLLNFIQNKLLYGLRYVEEQQILSGSGSGSNYSGLIHEAAQFDTSLVHGSWTKLDVLRRAIQQVDASDEVSLGFFVLNPADWGDLELTKTTYGEYIAGDPRTAMTPTLWGRPVVVTTAITAGTFLAGSASSCELIDRMDATFELSNSHSDFFVRNMIAARLEARSTLVIYRPNAFVTGGFSSSPSN